MSYLEKFRCKKTKCIKEIIVPVQIINKENYFEVKSRCPRCSKKYKHKLPLRDKNQWLDFLRNNFPRCDACGAVNKHMLKLQRDDLEANILKMAFDIPHQLGIQCLYCNKLRKKVISRGCWNDVVDYNPKVQVVSTVHRSGTLILDLDMEKALAEAEHYSQLANTARQEKRYNDFILNAFEMFERRLKYLSMKWLGGYAKDASVAELIKDLRPKAITLPDLEKNQHWQNIRDKVLRGIYNIDENEAQEFSRYYLRLRMPLDDFLKFEQEKQPNTHHENIPTGSSLTPLDEIKPHLNEYKEPKNQPRPSYTKILEEVQSAQPRRDNIRTCPFCGTENNPSAEFCQACGTWLPPQ